MTKKTLRTIARSAAAAFLAAAIIPAFAGGQDTRETGDPGQTRVERARPRGDLGLTAEQEKALEEFRKARRDENQAFREDMAELRSEMRELAKDHEANRAKIDALIDRSAGLWAERQKKALRARAEMDKIFTREQLDKLKSFRTRIACGAGLAGHGMRGPGRLGIGWPAGIRAGVGRMARLRALRHITLHRWWRW
jgi:Spy/CpxP family protein refolding chaperone